MDSRKHLADDDLDVLVGDGHTLVGVDTLNLGNDVALDGLGTAIGQKLLEVDRALGQALANRNQLTIRYFKVLIGWDLVLFLGSIGLNQLEVVFVKLDRSLGLGLESLLAIGHGG